MRGVKGQNHHQKTDQKSVPWLSWIIWPVIVAVPIYIVEGVYWFLGFVALYAFVQLVHLGIKLGKKHAVNQIIEAIIFGAASGIYYATSMQKQGYIKNTNRDGIGIGIVVFLLFLLPLVPWQRLMSQNK